MQLRVQVRTGPQVWSQLWVRQAQLEAQPKAQLQAQLRARGQVSRPAWRLVLLPSRHGRTPRCLPLAAQRTSGTTTLPPAPPLVARTRGDRLQSIHHSRAESHAGSKWRNGPQARHRSPIRHPSPLQAAWPRESIGTERTSTTAATRRMAHALTEFLCRMPLLASHPILIACPRMRKRLAYLCVVESLQHLARDRHASRV